MDTRVIPMVSPFLCGSDPDEATDEKRIGCSQVGSPWTMTATFYFCRFGLLSLVRCLSKFKFQQFLYTKP